MWDLNNAITKSKPGTQFPLNGGTDFWEYAKQFKYSYAYLAGELDDTGLEPYFTDEFLRQPTGKTTVTPLILTDAEGRPGTNAYEILAFMSQSSSMTVGYKSVDFFDENIDIRSLYGQKLAKGNGIQANHSFQWSHDAATTSKVWAKWMTESGAASTLNPGSPGGGGGSAALSFVESAFPGSANPTANVLPSPTAPTQPAASPQSINPVQFVDYSYQRTGGRTLGSREIGSLRVSSVHRHSSLDAALQQFVADAPARRRAEQQLDNLEDVSESHENSSRRDSNAFGRNVDVIDDAMSYFAGSSNSRVGYSVLATSYITPRCWSDSAV